MQNQVPVVLFGGIDMKGYTVYGEESGMEIRTTTSVKEEKGKVTKEGRITLRFFHMGASSQSLRFILTPVEAYWGYLKTVEIAKNGGKGSLTHRFESGDSVMVSALTLEKCQDEGNDYFSISVERNELKERVSMDLAHFLFIGELLRSLSSIQAWSSYKPSDEFSHEAVGNDSEPELFSGAEAGGEQLEEGKPAAGNGNRLLGVEIEAVRKDGQGLKVNGQWFAITDQSKIEVDALQRGMLINLSYRHQENGNPLVNALYPAHQ